MTSLFLKIINMSIAASWLVLAVLVLRFVLKKAPKWVNVLLWGIVAVRLICPFSIESALSLIPSAETIPDEVLSGPSFDVQTGIAPIDTQINNYLGDRYFEGVTVPANNGLNIMSVLAFVWLIGVIVFLLYTAFSYWRLQRRVVEAVILRENIYQSGNVGAPFVFGIIRPKIYLPYGIDSQELEHVVAHERAHIRHRDHWWKPLGFLLLTIHWFNPLMWLAYILLCRDIELACDEKVIKEMGNEQRADYTQALVSCSVNRRVIAACPLAFGEVGVKERVKSVMNYKKPAFWVIAVSAIACAVVAVCFLTNPAEEYELVLSDLSGEEILAEMPDIAFAEEDITAVQKLLASDEIAKAFLLAEEAENGMYYLPSDRYEKLLGSLVPKGFEVSDLSVSGASSLRGKTVYVTLRDYGTEFSRTINYWFEPDSNSFEKTISIYKKRNLVVAYINNNSSLSRFEYDSKYIDAVIEFYKVAADSAVVGKTYVYENEGIMGSFAITLYNDGTFTYYEGMASSYLGFGSWKQEGDRITMTDDSTVGDALVNHFRLDGDDLIFDAEDSSNFIYVKVQTGERFTYIKDGLDNISAEGEIKYIESFPAYIYSGNGNETVEGRALICEDVPENMAEDLILNYYRFTVRGDFDALSDMVANETLKISVENERKQFGEGIYFTETKIHEFSTLTARDVTPDGSFFDENSSYLIEAINKTAADFNLAEYTVVHVDLALKLSDAAFAQGSQILDGDYHRLFLVGRAERESEWKLYEIFWLE